MVQVTLILFWTASAYGVVSHPLTRRISEITEDAMLKWKPACFAAAGANHDACNQFSVRGITSLLAQAKPCDQQNTADDILDFAKTLKNGSDLIKFTQIFAQQPRLTPEALSVPYCQSPPRNPELNGIYQCQFQSSKPGTFFGGVSVGSNGTIPLGLTSPVTPPGSCPAYPAGPIPDGSQLVGLVDQPFAVNSANTTTATSAVSSSSTNLTIGSPGQGQALSSTATSASATSTIISNNGYILQNGLDAQALNAQFSTLTPTSPCQDNQQACVNNRLAECRDGKFILTKCEAGAECFVLPISDAPGTFVACTTSHNALSRIQATGAQGGVDGQ
ncbi:hypothetical protein BDW22DRAFT_1393621 [Trametopsis cervina]|nr:hypothetical protein BDW22DRAFT_1393621 [Trametopsis cervina]